MRVQIVTYDGVEDMDVIGPHQVLALAGRLGADVTATLVTGGEPAVITTAFGVRIDVGTGWSPEAAEVVLVPGGGYLNNARRGVWAEIGDGRLPSALRAAVRPGLVLASVCSGAMLLAAAGLLDNRPCTTHPMARAALAAAGQCVVEARVVDDGDIITAAGVTSGVDLALWLVEREQGAEWAIEIERYLDHERRGTIWRSHNGTGAKVSIDVPVSDRRGGGTGGRL